MAEKATTHDPEKIQAATERVAKFIDMNWGACECGDSDCPGWSDEAMEIVRIVLGEITPETKIYEDITYHE